MASAAERPIPWAADVTRAVLPFNLTPIYFFPHSTILVGHRKGVHVLAVRCSSVTGRGLSMTDQDLCYLSAKEALKLFRARKISPVELLKAMIDRSEKVNPSINC